MSLLLAAGHPNARHYRIGFLWSESRIVRQRENAKVLQDATVMQAVIGTVMCGKKANANLDKLLKRIKNSD